MNEVSSNVYDQQFEKIFQFFHDHCHDGPDEFDYLVVAMPNTHYRLADLASKRTGTVIFRVLIKATYDDVDAMPKPVKNYKDLSFLTNTKSSATLSHITSIQVYYCQLNEDDKPIHGKLWTYSIDDESYRGFAINKPDEENRTPSSSSEKT